MTKRVADEQLLKKVPPIADLLAPTIDALKALGGCATSEQIRDHVARIARLTPAVQKVSRPGGDGSELAYRLAWARTNLKHAGAITKTDARMWCITEQGRQLSPASGKAMPKTVQNSFRGGRSSGS